MTCFRLIQTQMKDTVEKKIPKKWVVLKCNYEPMLYEALLFTAGPFFKFTIVKSKRTQ